MSMILPIVSIASLAGLAFARSRPEANGKHPEPARIALDDLPRIRAALEAESPTVEVLAAAIQEARAVGFHGAAAMFEDRIKLLEAAAPAERTEHSGETDADLVERTIREAVDDVLGPDDLDSAVDPFDLPFADDGAARPSVDGDYLFGGEPDGLDAAPKKSAKSKKIAKKNGGKKSRKTTSKKGSGSGSGSISGAKS